MDAAVDPPGPPHNRGSSPQRDAKVAVVILNWNGAEFTIPCIKSVSQSVCSPQWIIVVDNGSRDNSPTKIKEAVPGIVLVRNEVNLGFTGGCNAGILQAVKIAAPDFIWLLNNDTVVDKNCLKWLLEAVASVPSAAAATGKIFFQDEPTRLWYGGASFNPVVFSARHRGPHNRDQDSFRRPQFVPFVSGCCMLIRTAALERVGLFDDRFFAYYEDLDWCLRARRAGMALVYEPRAQLQHKVSATSRRLTDKISGGTTTPFEHYHRTRNHFFVIRLHAKRPWQLLSAALLLLLNRLWFSLALLAVRRFDKVDAVWRGTRDGLKTNLKAVQS
jgi:GT2 family glycosyltransferase